MTGCDLVWRGAGLLTFAVAITIGAGGWLGTGAAIVLPCFALTIFGIVLMAQGKRVPAVWRVERSRHRALPQAIHARRCRGSGDRSRP